MDGAHRGTQVQGRCRNKRGCRSPATKRKHDSDQNKHELTYEGNSCAHEKTIKRL